MSVDVDRGYVPGLRDAEGNIIVAQPSAGVIKRFTHEGIAVYMYWNQPGVYYGDHGNELPEAMAKAARYDVEKFRRERQKREALGAASVAIEKEFAASNTRDVVLEREQYKLLRIADELYIIEYEDGTKMTPNPLPEDIARRVFDQLSPPPPKAAPKATK